MKKLLLLVGLAGVLWLLFRRRSGTTAALDAHLSELNAAERVGQIAARRTLDATPAAAQLGALPLTGAIITPFQQSELTYTQWFPNATGTRELYLLN